MLLIIHGFRRTMCTKASRCNNITNCSETPHTRLKALMEKQVVEDLASSETKYTQSHALPLGQ